MNIYLDMDDVVADWRGAAQDFLKMSWNKEEDRIPKEDWDRIKISSRFYRNLPLKAGAIELVNYCKNAVTSNRADGLFFLTAIPSDYSMPYAASDKVWWVNDHFPDIPIFFGPMSSDKWRHCKPGDILIDDRTSNCIEWRNVGGYSHIYRSWEDCKPWLEKQLNIK
jgi:hypothetical protein